MHLILLIKLFEILILYISITKMHSFCSRCLSFFNPGISVTLYRDLEDLIFKLSPFFLRYFKTDGFDVFQQVIVLSRSRDR